MGGYGLPWQLSTITTDLGQVGGVIAPQLFLDRYAYHGYKTPFAVMSATVGGTWLLTAWNWYLTRDLEAEGQAGAQGEE